MFDDVVGIKKTCSPECSRELELANRRENYAENPERVLAPQREQRRQRTIIKPCAVCGKEFDNRKGAKTCSPECLETYKRDKAHQRYLNNPEQWVRTDEQNARRNELRRAARVDKVCARPAIPEDMDARFHVACKTTFQPYGKQRYCSTECKQAVDRKRDPIEAETRACACAGKMHQPARQRAKHAASI
jgi:hypothetical protein